MAKSHLALEKDHPKGFPLSIFLHMRFSLLAEAGQADPAEPRAEQAGFHVVRSDQTSLARAMLQRHHQMKVRDFHYAYLSDCRGVAEVGPESKRAEDEEPTFMQLIVWKVLPQRSQTGAVGCVPVSS